MQIEKQSNGKYKVRVWDPNLCTKAYVGTFSNKAAGRTAGMKAEMELKTNGFIAERKDLTFGKLCDRHLETNLQLRATTRQWYETALKPARKFLGENTSVRRVSREDVQRYVASLIDSGKKDKTVCGYVKALGAVMEQAIEWKYREDNPVRRVRNLPANKRSADAIRVVTPAEHSLLVSAAPSAYRVMFSIWPFVGLRRSEMQGLTWDGVDLVSRRLNVQYQLREDGTLDTNLKTPKSTRTIHLTDRVVKELRAWKLESEPNALNLVFPTQRGLPQSCKPHFYKVWNTACKEAKLEGCNPHDMRHTFATWSLAAGENPKRVADEMGHEKPSMMLDVYLHLLPNEDFGATNRLEEWYDTQPARDVEPQGTGPIPALTAESG